MLSGGFVRIIKIKIFFLCDFIFSIVFFHYHQKNKKNDRKTGRTGKNVKPAQAPAFFEKVAALLRDAAIKDLALYIRR